MIFGHPQEIFKNAEVAKKFLCRFLKEFFEQLLYVELEPDCRANERAGAECGEFDATSGDFGIWARDKELEVRPHHDRQIRRKRMILIAFLTNSWQDCTTTLGRIACAKMLL